MAAPTTETSEQIREQLRVGVRMLEALDVQLKAAEIVIAREEDARKRITLALDRLEATSARLRESIFERTPASADVPSIAPTSGSLQASLPKKDTTAIAQMLRQLADDLLTASEPIRQHGITVHTPVQIDLSDPR